MAIERDPLDRDPATPATDLNSPRIEDPSLRTAAPVEREGGSFMPFVIGALVVVVGIIAFMMYGRDGGDPITTGTVSPPAATSPANPAAPPVTPPVDGTAPAKPAAPAGQ